MQEKLGGRESGSKLLPRDSRDQVVGPASTRELGLADSNTNDATGGGPKRGASALRYESRDLFPRDYGA